MSEILFLAHRVPYPPDRGDKVRSHHMLRHLSTLGRVHLAAFADDPRDLVHGPALDAWCASVTLLPRKKSNARAAAEAMAGGRPVSLAAFDSGEMRSAIARLLGERHYDAIYVYSGQMAQYLPADARFVMDFVDMDSAKFAAYADDARGPMRWMMRREAKLLGRFEHDIADRAVATLFVSEAEAALFRRETGAEAVFAIENGIDTDHFDPVKVAPLEETAPFIVFTGQMDYRPNIDAVCWFAAEVMPAIRAQHSEARFVIAGRNPTAAVQMLAGDGVIVTGEMADVRGWIAGAAVVVAPLLLARGVQNKVLEAMAMARPVVASTAAAEGIDHQGTIRIAADAEGFVHEINALMADPDGAAALGTSARTQAMARYGWDARLAPMASLLGLGQG